MLQMIHAKINRYAKINMYDTVLYNTYTVPENTYVTVLQDKYHTTRNDLVNGEITKLTNMFHSRSQVTHTTLTGITFLSFNS